MYWENWLCLCGATDRPVMYLKLPCADIDGGGGETLIQDPILCVKYTSRAIVRYTSIIENPTFSYHWDISGCRMKITRLIFTYTHIAAQVILVAVDNPYEGDWAKSSLYSTSFRYVFWSVLKKLIPIQDKSLARLFNQLTIHPVLLCFASWWSLHWKLIQQILPSEMLSTSSKDFAKDRTKYEDC